MIPVISPATHEKPGCSKTLIDNILMNSTEMLLGSGVFESGVSHHHPIFCFLDGVIPSEKDNGTRTAPKYDFCESNINKFLVEIEPLKVGKIEYTEKNFELFTNSIKVKIEENFKVNEENFSKSRRNILVNPWITPTIIASVNKKHLYYKQWKKSKTKQNKLGNNELYLKYKNFRKELRGKITCAKKKFYCRKFSSVQGNIKKHGPLLMN